MPLDSVRDIIPMGILSLVTVPSLVPKVVDAAMILDWDVKQGHQPFTVTTMCHCVYSCPRCWGYPCPSPVFLPVRHLLLSACRRWRSPWTIYHPFHTPGTALAKTGWSTLSEAWIISASAFRLGRDLRMTLSVIRDRNAQEFSASPQSSRS